MPDAAADFIPDWSFNHISVSNAVEANQYNKQIN